MLSLLFKNPLYKVINNIDTREGWCFAFRKSKEYHKTIKQIHPAASHEVRRYENISAYLEAFNKHKYFVSYDPYTFHSINAAICGCISIIYPVEGLCKDDWIKTTSLKEYFVNNSAEKLYGVAYGLDELKWAETTIHLVDKQWLDITEYYKKKHVLTFIRDIENFNENINTSQNNFFI